MGNEEMSEEEKEKLTLDECFVLAIEEKAAKLEKMHELKPSGKPIKKEAPKKKEKFEMRMIGGRMRKVNIEE